MMALRPGEPTLAEGWPAWLAWHKAQEASKRFTGSELAAEYQKIDGDYHVYQWDDSISLISEMRDIIHRFATTPHYDEVQP